MNTFLAYVGLSMGAQIRTVAPGGDLQDEFEDDDDLRNAVLNGSGPDPSDAPRIANSSPSAGDKPEYCTVLIGKSGAGKTTMINMTANFFLGKEYTDTRAIAITQSFSVVDPQTQKPKVLTLENNLPQFASFQTDRGGGQNQSQTTGCHSYRFETADTIFTFIDTPGFGDTNGTDQDRENVKEIVKAVVQKTQVHAIALVHKGSDCKNDPFSKYCISEIKTMMPIECRENFVVCFTCAANATKIDALETLRALEIPVDRYVTFENDCLLPKECVAKAFQPLAAVYWEFNKTSCQKLLATLRGMHPQETEPFADVLVTRHVLLEIVQEEVRNVDCLHKTKALHQRLANELASKLDEMKANADYNYVIDEERVEEVQQQMTRMVTENIAPKKVTQCFECHKICHDPCSLPAVYSRGHCEIQKCDAFTSGGNSAGGDMCNRCGHGYMVHGHTQMISREEKYTETIRKPTYKRGVKKTDIAKEKRYLAANVGKADAEQHYAVAEREMADLDARMQGSVRIIAFLYFLLNELSWVPVNEDYLQLLDLRTQELQSDKSITESEYQMLSEELRQKKQEYLLIKQAATLPQSSLVLDDSQKGFLQQRVEAKMKDLGIAVCGTLCAPVPLKPQGAGLAASTPDLGCPSANAGIGAQLPMRAF